MDVFPLQNSGHRPDRSQPPRDSAQSWCKHWKELRWNYFFPTGDGILDVNMSVPESTAFITFLSIKKQKPSVSFSRICLSKRDISPRGCKEEIKRQNNIAADLFWISSSWMEETKNKTSVPIKRIVGRVFFFQAATVRSKWQAEKM